LKAAFAGGGRTANKYYNEWHEFIASQREEGKEEYAAWGIDAAGFYEEIITLCWVSLRSTATYELVNGWCWKKSHIAREASISWVVSPTMIFGR
jgi:hypothetical protein